MNDDFACDLVPEWDFNREAFEAELIEEYGNLELALLDLSDRPDLELEVEVE